MPDILTYESYLNEICEIFRERAIESKREEDQLRKKKGIESSEYMYRSGHAQAYYEVLSTIRNQAIVMEIPLDILGLENFDPDKELL